MKRGRTDNEIDVVFTLVCLKTKTLYDLKIIVLSNSVNPSFDSGTVDSILYGIYFRPTIRDFYDNGEHVIFAQHHDEIIFSSLIGPSSSSAVERTCLLDRVYWTYETHTLVLNESETEIYGMFIQLENTSPNTTRLKIEVSVDMGLRWLPSAFSSNGEKEARYKSTPFFPPDIDPAAYNLKIDQKKIAQKSPLWFKLRGDVTGTKAYMYIGFWVPKQVEDPTWTVDGEKKFDAFSRMNMRFGTASEDYSIIMYLYHFPDRLIELVGSCPAPSGGVYPSGWNASPDALITDPTMTWNDIPDTIASQYDQSSSSSSGFDPTLGVLETKSSLKKLNMAGYFYPQIYLEMICSERIWTDLLRYRRTSESTNGGGGWKYKHIARIYRVYRHKQTEELIVRLIKYAHSNKHRLQEIVHTDPEFINARKYFDELGENASYKEIEITEGKGDELTRNYAIRKREFAKPKYNEMPDFVATQKKAKITQNNNNNDWKTDMNQRNNLIVQDQRDDNVALRSLLADQIHLLVNVLKNKK